MMILKILILVMTASGATLERQRPSEASVGGGAAPAQAAPPQVAPAQVTPTGTPLLDAATPSTRVPWWRRLWRVVRGPFVGTGGVGAISAAVATFIGGGVAAFTAAPLLLVAGAGAVVYGVRQFFRGGAETAREALASAHETLQHQKLKLRQRFRELMYPGGDGDGGFNIRNCSCRLVGIAICYVFMLVLELINRFFLMLLCRSPPTHRELGTDILFAAEQARLEEARHPQNVQPENAGIDDLLHDRLEAMSLDNKIQKKKELKEKITRQMKNTFDVWKEFSERKKQLRIQTEDLKREDERLSQELSMQATTASEEA